jgi:beta-galactosidase
MLWDIDTPNLYTLRTTLYDGDTAIDKYDTKFGFREILFDKDKGFFINGRNEKIKGVCAHQDFGLMGLVLPSSIARHRIRLFKEMGVNGYRAAHNMASVEEMDACDSMGMLVYAETRYFSSSEERMEELRILLKRDRNRPSVICWSVGNEEVYLSNTEMGARIAERLHYEVRKYDKTRPTTAALSNSPRGDAEHRHELIAPLDIMSYNYSIIRHAEFRADYPDKPFIVSECDALQTSRGHFYGDDATAGLFHTYDHVTSVNEFNMLRSASFAYAMEDESVAGLFVWAGTEHRGEAKWPRLCSQSGLVDLYLQKKEAFYQTKSQYDSTPMVHINPSSWNFAGLDGMPIKVVVFTNCSEVELILNGVSLGVKQTPPHYENPEWMVDYTRGELVAIGYMDGKEVCRDRIATTGKPHALRLYEDTVDAGAGEVHMFTCVCLDENGNEVPDACPEVFFTTDNAKLLGTGSDVTDHVPPQNSRRRMRMGKISIAVKAPPKGNSFTLFAESESLEKAYIKTDV